LCYLVFQLFSHKELYDDSHPNVFRSVKYDPEIVNAVKHPHWSGKGKESEIRKRPSNNAVGSAGDVNAPTDSDGHRSYGNNSEEASGTVGPRNGTPAATPAANVDAEAGAKEVVEEEHKPTMSVPFTIMLLVAITVVGLFIE
jgi:Ca2+:H+ antiporter